jgi:hypothetical protein
MTDLECKDVFKTSSEDLDSLDEYDSAKESELDEPERDEFVQMYGREFVRNYGPLEISFIRQDKYRWSNKYGIERITDLRTGRIFLCPFSYEWTYKTSEGNTVGHRTLCKKWKAAAELIRLLSFIKDKEMLNFFDTIIELIIQLFHDSDRIIERSCVLLDDAFIKIKISSESIRLATKMPKDDNKPVIPTVVIIGKYKVSYALSWGDNFEKIGGYSTTDITDTTSGESYISPFHYKTDKEPNNWFIITYLLRALYYVMSIDHSDEFEMTICSIIDFYLK